MARERFTAREQGNPERGVQADERDAAGRYRLRLPYSNRGAPPSVRTAPAWELACEGEQAALVVEEAQVRSGASLAGPSLCVGRDAPEPAASADDAATGLR